MNTQDDSMTEQQVSVWFNGADPDAIYPQKTEAQVREMIEARRAANGNDA
jgi:hypothetical protein